MCKSGVSVVEAMVAETPTKYNGIYQNVNVKIYMYIRNIYQYIC